MSGHLDSWDVGQGAMDDGGGAFISWQALSIMRQLNLRAKRTIRAVLWTGEEVGLVGAQQYYDKHKKNISKFNLVMESDIGTYHDADGGDVNFWILNGVPGGSLSNDNDKYFYFHHTHGDTMTVENADDLDLCAAMWAVVAYVVADLDEMLPR